MTAPTLDPTVTDTVTDAPQGSVPLAPVAPVVEEDVLVEDVSIDGMCGVY